MKKIKNLFIALLTLITFNSFATPVTYTVTKGVTTNVTCNVGDTIKFYATTASVYAVTINTTTVIAPHSCNVSPYYIGYYVIVGGETSFTINSTVNWIGTITVNIATGVGELSNTSVTELIAFPNPTNGDFKIKFNSNKEKSDVVIYDIQGRLVFQNKDERTIGKNELVISNEFASGIYIVKVEDKTFKITITR
jgi:hypothetical protein